MLNVSVRLSGSPGFPLSLTIPYWWGSFPVPNPPGQVALHQRSLHEVAQANLPMFAVILGWQVGDRSVTKILSPQSFPSQYIPQLVLMAFDHIDGFRMIWVKHDSVDHRNFEGMPCISRISWYNWAVRYVPVDQREVYSWKTSNCWSHQCFLHFDTILVRHVWCQTHQEGPYVGPT